MPAVHYARPLFAGLCTMFRKGFLGVAQGPCHKGGVVYINGDFILTVVARTATRASRSA
jgi:hypothetical protein